MGNSEMGLSVGIPLTYATLHSSLRFKAVQEKSEKTDYESSGRRFDSFRARQVYLKDFKYLAIGQRGDEA